MKGMKKILVSLSIIGVVAVIAVGSTVAYFRDVETSTGNVFTAGTLDLQIRDQNNPWGNGVTGTWSATDMKPGDEYLFNVPFVWLRNVGSINADHLEITCDYSIDENDCLEPETNCANIPDDMAKEMIITRCEYYQDGVWSVNCLTNLNPKWRIEDQDGDNKITFYDLKNDKLDDLTPPNPWTTFEMSVKFSELAGNDFQGDTFDLTMIFTLNQDASQ